MTPFARTIIDHVRTLGPFTVGELVDELLLLRRMDPHTWRELPKLLEVEVPRSVDELVAYSRLEKIGDSYRWLPERVAEVAQGRMF